MARMSRLLGHFVHVACMIAVSSPSVSNQPTGEQGLAQERKVHAFFYLWYGTPEVDGEWRHWNHEVLPHWSASVREKYPSGVRFKPPGEAHSPFYPHRGLYSSNDKVLLKTQLEELMRSGVGVVVLSWSGRPDLPGTHDTQGIQTDSLITVVLDVAATVGMEVSLHLEPYHDRSATSVRDDIGYLLDKYGSHPALHRTGLRSLPLMYVYDSYRITASDWSQVLRENGKHSIRGSELDAVLVALWLDGNGGEEAQRAGFDGVYTYFAADGFSFGSTTGNWDRMARFAREHKMLFIPSVGPGYDDSKIRPWNRQNMRERENGGYYDRMWERALSAGASVVSITSYNEWGEGTQVRKQSRLESAGFEDPEMESQHAFKIDTAGARCEERCGMLTFGPLCCRSNLQRRWLCRRISAWMPPRGARYS